RPAGSLPKGTAVTLSDAIISRASDHRQFTQVTLNAETKNTKGEALAAGARLWTVSDRGALRAAVPSVALPSWWAKCSPAYGELTGAEVRCTAGSELRYYLSSDDVMQRRKAGELAAGFPLTYEAESPAQQMSGPPTPARQRGAAGMETFSWPKSGGARVADLNPLTPEGARQGAMTGPVDKYRLVTLGSDAGHMKKGDRVWVIAEANGLKVASDAQPVFDEVVIPPTPVAVNAGDGIGHMGFYQLPTERESESRYQVHIECISTGDGLPAFLTNPEKAGEDAPAFLKYPEGATLFAKDGEEKLVDAKRLTRAPGILTLSGVPVIKEGDRTTHYRIRPEGGWLAAGDVKLLSQWALGELGFTTLDRKPQSFELLDGVTPPTNVVQGILQELYRVAHAEPRTGAALYKYNYKYLLDEIDQNKDGYYSEQEYLQAVHLPSYRDHLYRLIAKHPSEWYYGKDDELWLKYLNTLKKDAPEWKRYLETFIDRLAWMKQVPGIGPEPWHMHPVVFLEALKPIGDGVTYDQLKRIFPQASDEVLNTVVNELRGKLETFKLNTPTRLRHFFSQIKGEVGPQMKGKTEGFQFSPDALRSFSRYYRQHSSEAEQDGYEKNNGGAIIRRADEQAIGRKHYLRLNGNRKTNPDDGYIFRGRGLIQITGYEKYHGFPTDYHKYWSGDVPDSVSNPDIINVMPYAIRSAIWYWLKYKPYLEDKKRGSEDVADVTKIVNGGDMGLAERKTAYKLCEEVFI
ncbi:hypothetical protein, partial [Erwinia sp. B116]|uniref:glycoside hydrolase family 19 protein n=1 Tax=Erwinia sp. B116 TaxID=1561024 RepID=UPI001E2E727B